MNSKPRTPTSDSRPAPSADVESAAAEWLARSDRGLDAEAQVQFEQWRAADPRHAAAWHELESTWRTFDRPRQRGVAEHMIRELTTRRRRRRRRTMFGSAAALAVAVAVAVVFLPPPTPGSGTLTASDVVASRPERRQLVDGSFVELNAAAQIEVHFSATRRDVRLVQGEAHFAVAKDASRPFVVATPLGEVRAVGTAFAVALRSDEVAVLVTEGTVALDRPTATTQPSVSVSAGNSVVVPGSASPDSPLRVEPVTPEEIERRLAWRAPRLELSNSSLTDVVAALNRENRVQLEVADSEVAQVRLSGVFRADQAETFVRLLEAHYGMRAERRGPDVIVLHRRK